MTSAAHAGLLAAGRTDPGTQREVNEDRLHCDAARGVFMVIDGVGGQAAGGKAADVALDVLRRCLDRDPAPVPVRIRNGITFANNEIRRLASTRDEWRGMACVLTVAVVHDEMVTFGHVGDTRLYKLRHGRIEKLTRDHSPIGEREDACELSELQAMQHPRRNEVYRDVGSDPHEPGDAGFIDVGQAPFERDAALLLCSDGLTDLVDSTSIARMVQQHAGDPAAVAAALVDAANAAGGKDNVTVVYVEGDRFAPAGAHPVEPAAGRSGTRSFFPSSWLGVAALAAGIAGTMLIPTHDIGLTSLLGKVSLPMGRSAALVTVPPAGSIAAAVRAAAPGTQILVEPGEYREPLVLKSGVRLVSRIPRAARIRLPASTSNAESVPAVLAQDVAGAELVGFTISGDAATPLAVGIAVRRAGLSIVDVEITGATHAAVEFAARGDARLIGSEIRDNPGAAIVARDGAEPRLSHNTFIRNGTSDRARAAFVIDGGSTPTFTRNVFVAAGNGSFATLDHHAHAALARDNWFVAPPSEAPGRMPLPALPEPHK